MECNWISVEDALPGTRIDEQGNYDGVLAYLKEEPDGGFRCIVSNTKFVRDHPGKFLYWMPLPPAPRKKESKMISPDDAAQVVHNIDLILDRMMDEAMNANRDDLLHDAARIGANLVVIWGRIVEEVNNKERSG